MLLSILAVNLTVAAIKFAFGLWSRSVAVEADALHSTFDGLANLVGLASMAMAVAPPDDEHPYGHHRFELLGALGIAALIAATAAGIAWEAVNRVGAVTNARMEPAGLALLGGMALVSLLVSRYEGKIGKELDSPVLQADSLHTLTDFLGTLVVLAAAIGDLLQQLGTESVADEIERPVVAIYQADESDSILFRVCVSDAAFLHMGDGEGQSTKGRVQMLADIQGSGAARRAQQGWQPATLRKRRCALSVCVQTHTYSSPSAQ